MNNFRGVLVLLFIVLFGSMNYAQDTLRVMSFNILHGATLENDFNLDSLAGIIKSYDPHLVALQEVDFKTRRAKNYDLPTELGYRTKMAPLFARAMYYDGGEYGEAILSKFSFVSSENLALPHLPDSEPRAAAIVQIETANENLVQFAGTHLDHQKDSKDREMQARALLERFHSDSIPTLLLGDLNAEPNSETISILKNVFEQGALEEVKQPTYPSKAPTKKIDYILFDQSGRWKLLDYKVLCENYASDHCIVMATLLLYP